MTKNSFFVDSLYGGRNRSSNGKHLISCRFVIWWQEQIFQDSKDVTLERSFLIFLMDISSFFFDDGRRIEDTQICKVATVHNLSCSLSCALEIHSYRGALPDHACDLTNQVGCAVELPLFEPMFSNPKISHTSLCGQVWPHK